eukprot:gnl/MRDRNA2_/MRDRNA2_211206_c0_seq1.p1 gnl/MRDRNA2_/MRDRNA2_211206_c0~~gnl/MRDRNA2_/MRDRNA2_211206_c0_seq1.p1  ORF type:complete len:469 (+),score=38.04 gnl/MRDRNA2_/MRDRNA2_211206_c0_seq1:98-1408(+)
MLFPRLNTSSATTLIDLDSGSQEHLIIAPSTPQSSELNLEHKSTPLKKYKGKRHLQVQSSRSPSDEETTGLTTFEKGSDNSADFEVLSVSCPGFDSNAKLLKLPCWKRGILSSMPLVEKSNISKRGVRYCAGKMMLVPFHRTKAVWAAESKLQEHDPQLSATDQVFTQLSLSQLRLLLRNRGIASPGRSRSSLEERLRLALSKECTGPRSGEIGNMTQRFSPHRGFCDRASSARGPRGNILCRWCGDETASRSSTFCSSECVHQHKIRSSGQYIRQCVLIRDKGICARCGLNAHLLYRQMRKAHSLSERWLSILKGTSFEGGKGLSFSRRFRAGDFWHVDHILPVSAGGGSCGLDNLRTLCKPCHALVTRNVARCATSGTQLKRTAATTCQVSGHSHLDDANDELPLGLLTKLMGKSSSQPKRKCRRVGRWYRRNP